MISECRLKVRLRSPHKRRANKRRGGGGNCLVFIAGRWDELPDSAPTFDPSQHLIGQSPSSRASVPNPNCIRRRRNWASWGGLERGDTETELIVQLLRRGRDGGSANAKNSPSSQGGGGLVCRFRWWREMARQAWRSDYGTLHKFPVVIQHLESIFQFRNIQAPRLNLD